MRLDWTEDDHAEWDALLAEAWESSEVTRARVDVLLAGVRDGVQAQRQWAQDVEDEALRNGLSSAMKRWAKDRTRTEYRKGDRVVSRPGVVGITRADDGGAALAVQLELDQLTWDELRTKAAEYERAIAAYADNRSLVVSLLSLREAAPGARTPREAAAALGTTVGAWLMRDAA